MSVQAENNQAAEAVHTDIDKNFRLLERKLQKEIEMERQARLQAEERAAAAERASLERNRSTDDDDDDSEPYVDRRKLKRELNKFGEQTKQQTVSEVQRAVQQALEGERQANYLKQNSDFNQIMTSDIVQKFADAHPELAENILKMPEGFERQKLVYANIKALGMDKPQQKESSIQDKINRNRQTPNYQPSGVGTAPYSAQGDFSEAGKKSAYEKMMQLKKDLRI